MEGRQAGWVGDRTGREGEQDVRRVGERGSERRALLEEEGEVERRGRDT